MIIYRCNKCSDKHFKHVINVKIVGKVKSSKLLMKNVAKIYIQSNYYLCTPSHVCCQIVTHTCILIG